MNDLRVCFLGDSFVNGTGDDEALGWTGRVSRNARRQGVPLTFYNLGIRRDTSAQIMKRYQTDISARLDKVECRKLVVFSFGANDVTLEAGSLRVTTDDTTANTRRMLEWSGRRYPTLMIGPGPIVDDPEHDARVSLLSARLTEVCSKLTVPYLEVHAIVSRNSIWRHEALKGDGVHPNALGYEVFATLVDEWDPWRACVYDPFAD